MKDCVFQHPKIIDFIVRNCVFEWVFYENAVYITSEVGLYFVIFFLSHRKLQSDLKTTKVEEMKQQMEVFYNEIVRLQNSKDTGMDKSFRY